MGGWTVFVCGGVRCEWVSGCGRGEGGKVPQPGVCACVSVLKWPAAFP